MENLIFLSIIAAVVVFDAILIIYVYKLKKRFDLFFQGGKTKNLEEVLSEQIKKTRTQEEGIKGILGKIKELGRISQKSFQKIGVTRFNPFENVGGDQSFIIALLDKQNDGVVISSLYARDGNRVYAKPIKNGESQYPLSNEEKEVIKKACSAQ